MKISLICFSLSGCLVMERLERALTGQGHSVRTASKSRYLPEGLSIPLKDWCREQFETADALIFIGATGIAVRTVAPFVVSKTSDPAVLVIDELGRHVISLLSGHLGGANALTELCSQILGAEPVITTATDLNGRFAVDVFAREKKMRIFHMKAAKAVSAALLAGEPVGLYSEYPIEGRLPEGLVLCEKDGRPAGTSDGETPLQVGIAIAIHKQCLPFAETTVLVPRTLYVGLGCRKGKSAGAIACAVDQALEGQGIYPEALKKAASIDLKAKEAGILEFCRERGLSYETFSQTELEEVKGNFTPSAFVKQVAGVDNVCERAAIRAGGRLWIQKKTSRDGVTVALAQEDWSVTF